MAIIKNPNDKTWIARIRAVLRLLKPGLPNSIADFLAASLTLCILYRIFFFAAIFPTSLEPVMRQFITQSLGMMSDFIACAWMTAILFCIHILLITITPQKFSRGVLEIIAFIVFILVAGLYLANLRTFVSVYIGIDYSLLKTYLSTSSLTNISAFITMADIVMFILMLSAYISIKCITMKHKQSIIFSLILIYFIFSFYSVITFIKASSIIAGTRFTALYTSPVNQVMIGYLQSFNKYNRYQVAITNQQLQSLKLIDASFLQPQKNKPALQLLNMNKDKKNIVIFVLESVGYNALFDQTSGKANMPFLQSLAKQGVWFENNYTGGNISALGQFSIFTGLYPNPNHSHYEMRSDLNIPSLIDWLDHSYHSFLVSASNDLYFAVSINKTFSNYYNASNIHPNIKIKDLFFNIFLNEVESFKFFLNRLAQVDTPFVAVYWSGAAHFPYKDYRATANNTNLTSIERYHTGLALLDQEIKDVYQSLKAKNLLKNTIFIVVGDHGDSFGEHNIYLHGFSLYQPEIKVPLLIYAPSYLPAKRIQSVTSSVDLLPTLLDLMHIPYQDNLQGDSLLRHAASNKYVFAYGDLDEIAAIDKHNTKMIISFAKNSCVTYDLNKDTDEIHPSRCINHEQEEAILKFRNFQPKILTEFNAKNKSYLPTRSGTARNSIELPPPALPVS